MSVSFFDLMKYASTGIASPAMTAYDKMRALAAFGGGKTQTLTGIPPLSFTANGKPLISWSMLGNGQQTGTPTPDAPIMPDFCGVRTNNLAPPLAQWVDGYASNSDGTILPADPTMKEKTSDFIDISELETITFSYGNADGFPSEWQNSAWRAIAFYTENKSFIQRKAAGGSESYSPEIPVSTKYVRLSFRSFGHTTNTMLNAGSTTLPYEPYGWKIPITCTGQTTPVYLGQTPTVRKIGKLILTGDESWIIRNGNYFSSVIDALTVNNSRLFCTHFVDDGTDGIRIVSGTAKLKVASAAVSDFAADLTSFKAYLASQYAAGTPVCVWYVLATPETAIVNEPIAKIGDYADELHSADAGVSIPTVKGVNTLTVDTELQPSNMTITGSIKEM